MPLCLAFALAASACGGGGDGASNAEETSQLTVAMTADLLTLYPPDETAVGVDVFGHIFDALTIIDRDGTLQPRLSTEWRTEDGVVWEFYLHPDAKWHDGSPVTAADVAYTYNYTVENEGLATHGYVDMLEKAEAVDDHTVRFTLKYPVAAFDRWTSTIFIVPEGTAERTTPEEFTQNPIGSGPYKVEQWEGGHRLVLRANEDYHGGPPTVDEIVFVSVPEESARLAGLESGELDVIGKVPPPEVARLQQSSDIKVVTAPNNRNVYIGFNTNMVPTNDVRVREAINIAIDRNTLTEQVLEGLGDPIGQPAAPVTFGYSDDPRFSPAPYDPDRARELLSEAGYDGEELVLTYPTGELPFAPQVAEAIRGYLTEVGLKVKLEAVEWGTMIERWRARDFDHMHLFGFGPGILDANIILNSLFESGSRGYYESEELDQLAVEQAAQTDPEQRLEIIEQAWDIDRELVLNAWLYNEYDAYAYKADIDWEPYPNRRMHMWDAVVNR